jgi:AraC-like DNA-binding protein
MPLAAVNRDQFEMERWALAAVTALQADTRGQKPRGQYAARRADIDAVIAICRAIETDPVSRRSIAVRRATSGLSVSQSCYRSGFENLSHFCRTFQRTFGVRASTWHTLTVRETRRKVQDLRACVR